MRLSQDTPNLSFEPVGRAELPGRLAALRPAPGAVPDISVVVPVNARGDLRNVPRLLGDIARYEGPCRLEVVLSVNNFDEDAPPPELAALSSLGATVVAVPNTRKAGEAPVLSARIPGLRTAASEQVVMFDADCRIPNPTALLDWYARSFARGASAAYSHVAHYEFIDALSVRVWFAIHHATRWFKRVVLRIPTTRGSNYGVRRSAMLDCYERSLLGDDLNVGPALKRLHGPVAYSRDPQLTVYTSGRMFEPGWREMVPYFLYRLRYNLRVLPVRPGVASRTGRDRDPVRQYDTENRPVRSAR